MQMVGHPKHVAKALDVGMDIICAQVGSLPFPCRSGPHDSGVQCTDLQGGEGGGHTGTTATSILIPACVDACKGRKSPLTGGPVSLLPCLHRFADSLLAAIRRITADLSTCSAREVVR